MHEPSVELTLKPQIAAPMLLRVLTIMAVASLLLGVAAMVIGFKKTWLLSFANASVAGLMLHFARRGLVRTAAVVVVLSLLATSLYAIVTGQGLHDDAQLILPSAFLLASLLLGGASVAVIALLSCVAIATIGIAQVHGFISPVETHRLAYHDILEICIMLGALATFAHYVVSLMRMAIVDARNAHQSVQDILDATTEAIFIHDAKDGRIVSVNEPTLEMFGCSREEFLGQTPFDMKKAADAFNGDKAADYLRLAVTCGPQSFEWLTQRRDGSSFWVEVSLRSARIAQQARVVAVVRDITERRRLEQRVREAEMFRAVGQLAGGIAHDFNNQLVGILGNAEFLRNGLLENAELRECAESVLSSGQRAADLTQELLAFARKGRRRNLPVDLHQLVREVVTVGRRSIDKRISIEQHLTATRSVVRGDPGALQNALLNLLLNARDAMPCGGAISFRTENCDATAALAAFDPVLAAGQYVIVEVVDDGTGIGSDIVGRIFEPFFTTKESGTGMGLAAVHGTVLEHQGALAVESELGKGAKFRLCLPLTDDPVAIEEPRSGPVAPRAGGRVLVIDDENAVAKVVALSLEMGGLTVDTCTSALSGLERYRPGEHDLVLLDMMMPELDGVEVLRRIRALNPDAKIMLMSGHASEAVEARLQEFPDVTIVSKPFSPMKLLEDVMKRLGG